MKKIRIVVAGATGRMGQEVIKLIQEEEHFQLVGAISRQHVGKDIGEVIGIPVVGVLLSHRLEEVLDRCFPDVLIDFTTPSQVRGNIDQAIDRGVRPVIGTSGLTQSEVNKWNTACKEQQIGGIVAPNFALGAVLMMVFAAKAARYLPHVEIIEMHHDKKLDAPSGTAIKTAEMISAVRQEIRQGNHEEKELLEGARGAYRDGYRIHSVRLPGFVAHQEVLFASSGQLLTLRHDSFDRQSFMPGVKLAVEKVMKVEGMLYGLENILDL